MINWYESYGFGSNPFSIKPAAFHDDIIGYELRDVFEKIDSGDVLFIKGKYGSGKTTILKHIIRRFGGKKQVIYHSTSKGLLKLEKLLLNKSFANRLFKNLPYDMTLLVDEAQELSRDEAEEISRFYNEGNIKSVVFFGTVYKKNVFTQDFNASLRDNTMVLGELSNEHATELIRKRVGNIKLLPDEAILQIYQRAGSNPRKFLELCEDVCKYAFETGNEVVNEEILEKFFPNLKRKAARKKAKKETKKIKAKKDKTEKKKHKAKKTKAGKKSAKTEKIVVQEIDSKKMAPQNMIMPAEYNLDNVRSYEKEMSTIKEEPDLEEEKK